MMFKALIHIPYVQSTPIVLSASSPSPSRSCGLFLSLLHRPFASNTIAFTITIPFVIVSSVSTRVLLPSPSPSHHHHFHHRHHVLQVTLYVYTWYTYAQLIFLVPMVYISEYVFSYYHVVLIGVLGRVISQFLLLLGRGLFAMQVAQFIFGFASSTKIVTGGNFVIITPISIPIPIPIPTSIPIDTIIACIQQHFHRHL